MNPIRDGKPIKNHTNTVSEHIQPMPKPSFVFFDHGGTLSHITKDTPQIVQEILTERGYSFEFENVDKAFAASQIWWQANQDRLPRGSRKSLLVEAHVELVKELGIKRDAEKIAGQIQEEWHQRAGFQLYPDSLPCLEELKHLNVPMGIITQNLDTIDEFKDHALRINSIGHYFSVVVTSESSGFDKPDPRLFQVAARLTASEPTSIIHVGDNYELDVLGAQGAGMQAVLIDRSGGREKGCTTITSLSELPSIIT